MTACVTHTPAPPGSWHGSSASLRRFALVPQAEAVRPRPHGLEQAYQEPNLPFSFFQNLEDAGPSSPNPPSGVFSLPIWRSHQRLQSPQWLPGDRSTAMGSGVAPGSERAESLLTVNGALEQELKAGLGGGWERAGKPTGCPSPACRRQRASCKAPEKCWTLGALG